MIRGYAVMTCGSRGFQGLGIDIYKYSASGSPGWISAEEIPLEALLARDYRLTQVAGLLNQALTINVRKWMVSGSASKMRKVCTTSIRIGRLI